MSSLININYTIVNRQPSVKPEFKYTLPMEVVAGTTFFDVMIQALNEDEHFEFSCDMYPKMGAFITRINHLSGDGAYYWAFTKIDQQGNQCMLPVGVSTYVPGDDDDIVFEYWDQSKSLPQCDKVKAAETAAAVTERKSKVMTNMGMCTKA